MHLASFKVHQVDSVFQSFRAGEKGYYVTPGLKIATCNISSSGQHGHRLRRQVFLGPCLTHSL